VIKDRLIFFFERSYIYCSLEAGDFGWHVGYVLACTCSCRAVRRHGKEATKEKKRKEKQILHGAADLPAASCAKELRAANMSARAMQAEEPPERSPTIPFYRPASCCSGRRVAASG
jgi:hypothetical protein